MNVEEHNLHLMLWQRLLGKLLVDSHIKLNLIFYFLIWVSNFSGDGSNVTSIYDFVDVQYGYIECLIYLFNF